MLSVCPVGRTNITAVSRAMALDLLLKVQDGHEKTSGLPIRLVNSYSVALAERDPEYRRLLGKEPGLNLADGRPVAAVVRIGMKKRSRDRFNPHVRGPSLFRDALEATNSMPNINHAFIGGSEATLLSLRSVIDVDFPSLRVTSFFAPTFTSNIEALVGQIVSHIQHQSTFPTHIWISLGTPKQDFVADRVAYLTGATTIAVGAAFNFVSGETREAPQFIRRIGLEWAHRLATEPQRLWRRYLVGNMVFAYSVVKQFTSDYLSRGNAK